MNNEWKIFDTAKDKGITEIQQSKESQDLGFVYVLEWNDKVKIGSTKNLTSRMTNLLSYNKYGEVLHGRVAISEPCLNYAKYEIALHKYFKNRRIPDTELFDINLEEAINNNLDFNFDTDIEAYRQRIDDGSKKFIEFAKNQLPGAQERFFKWMDEHQEESFNFILEFRDKLSQIAKLYASIIGYDDPGLFEFYKKYPNAKLFIYPEEEEASYNFAKQRV